MSTAQTHVISPRPASKSSSTNVPSTRASKELTGNAEQTEANSGIELKGSSKDSHDVLIPGDGLSIDINDTSVLQVPLDVVKLNEAISTLSADELAAELRTWPQEAADRVERLLKVPLDVVKLNEVINRLSADELVAELRTWPQGAADRVEKLLKVPLDVVNLNEAISKLSGDEIAAALGTWPQEAVDRVEKLLKAPIGITD
jgi:ribosome assembly protein YihI (activator of Der GTPase)